MLGLLTIVSLSLAASAPPAAQASDPVACTVAGQKVLWERLPVAVEGESPLLVTLHQWPLEVTARAGAETAQVSSLAGLRFAFSVPLAEVPYRVARRTRVARSLGVMSRATRLKATGVTPAGELQVQPALAPGVRLDPQVVACRQATLPARDKDVAVAMLKDPNPKRRVVPTGDSVSLRRKRGGPVELKIDWAGGYLPLERLSDRKGWMRVRARWDDGSQVQGYIASAEASERVGLGRPAGKVAKGLECSRRFGYAYFGPATLKGGRTIHSRAGGPVWATAKEPARLVVLGKSGLWIRVMEIEGLLPAEGCYHERAWVRRDDLRYP